MGPIYYQKTRCCAAWPFRIFILGAFLYYPRTHAGDVEIDSGVVGDRSGTTTGSSGSSSSRTAWPRTSRRRFVGRCARTEPTGWPSISVATPAATSARPSAWPASSFPRAPSTSNATPRARTRRPLPVSPDGVWTDLPLIVLVDEGSASASEIVAGAPPGQRPREGRRRDHVRHRHGPRRVPARGRFGAAHRDRRVADPLWTADLARGHRAGCHGRPGRPKCCRPSPTHVRDLKPDQSRPPWTRSSSARWSSSRRTDEVRPPAARPEPTGASGSSQWRPSRRMIAYSHERGSEAERSAFLVRRVCREHLRLGPKAKGAASFYHMRPRARMRSPAAGARRLILNSVVELRRQQA